MEIIDLGRPSRPMTTTYGRLS